MVGNFQYEDMKDVDCKKMLVLSLGTGIGKHEEKYNTTVASRWGMLGWVFNNGVTPLIDIFGDASADMDNNLAGEAASMDIATIENMETLVQIGEVDGVTLAGGDINGSES
ncbi:hypothetical protein CQW23_10029 [Capsicum baccatum]|uniref:Uncharacterized protein n=1 Tax=Capsicum baccatum TaxID=33114 RepID=A0A2G2WYH7_CAPBA|nr:hypothetical protein CQW23_10029 [Capsicum baccatum]